MPYRYVAKEANGLGGHRSGTLVLLPEILEVKGAVEPETRHRGPFSSVVYTARLTMQGRFAAPDTSLIDALAPEGGFAHGVTDDYGYEAQLLKAGLRDKMLCLVYARPLLLFQIF